MCCSDGVDERKMSRPAATSFWIYATPEAKDVGVETVPEADDVAMAFE